ncbi:MAG: histidine kinase dimerization/phospho-acceptor domain-containing protein, partial [Bacteroidota bacterium]
LKEIAWTQSHMVRAPLTRIMGLANALQRGIVPDSERQQYLNYIKNSSDELDDVIKNITAKTIVN